MEHVRHVALSEAVNTVSRFIDHLLSRLSENVDRPGYAGDRSNTITGLKGVVAYLYAKRDSYPSVYLEVLAPENLLVQLTKKYESRYKVVDQSHERRVFHVR